jgi:hypothetical protein
MPKATKEVVAQRVEKVLELRLAGATLLDIRAYANQPGTPDAPEEPWGVSDSQLKKYMTQASALAKTLIEKKADRWLALHVLRRERLFAHAMDVGDWSNARQVLADQAELLDLYPAKAVKHTGPKGDEPVQVDVMSGGQPLEIPIDPAAAAAFLADLARLGAGIPGYGGTQSLDPAAAAPAPAAIPPP